MARVTEMTSRWSEMTLLTTLFSTSWTIILFTINRKWVSQRHAHCELSMFNTSIATVYKVQKWDLPKNWVISYPIDWVKLSYRGPWRRVNCTFVVHLYTRECAACLGRSPIHLFHDIGCTSALARNLAIFLESRKSRKLYCPPPIAHTPIPGRLPGYAHECTCRRRPRADDVVKKMNMVILPQNDQQMHLFWFWSSNKWETSHLE